MESYIQIQQLNGGSGDVTYKKLEKLLKQCTAKKKDCDCAWLLKRLLEESGADINAGRSNNAEQRRIMWTTHYNLNTSRSRLNVFSPYIHVKLMLYGQLSCSHVPT